MQVVEVAKKHGVSVQKVLNVLEESGIQGKDPASPLSETEIGQVEGKLSLTNPKRPVRIASNVKVVRSISAPSMVRKAAPTERTPAVVKPVPPSTTPRTGITTVAPKSESATSTERPDTRRVAAESKARDLLRTKRMRESGVKLKAAVPPQPEPVVPVEGSPSPSPEPSQVRVATKQVRPHPGEEPVAISPKEAGSTHPAPQPTPPQVQEGKSKPRQSPKAAIKPEEQRKPFGGGPRRRETTSKEAQTTPTTDEQKRSTQPHKRQVRELETRPSAPPPDTITVAPGTTPKRGKARRAKTAEEIAESKKDRESSVVERKVLTAFTGRKRTKSQKYKRTKRERMAATQEAQREKDEKERTTLRIHEATTVADVAHGLNVNSAEIVKILLDLGRVVTVNQHLDRETIDLIADEFGFDVEESSLMEINPFLELEEIEDEGSRVPRPPVVTVMGHVDHGKTKLMDAIRSADVASREAGGITQHIGAYYVLLDSGKSMCFIDTPGHEAFTAMRARGAMVTDVVVLVVAADDGVMPQTKEAIAHARAAGVPILVAINKIDLPSANPERVKNELAAEGLVPEDWGGQTPVVEISATKKIGIEALLDLIHLQAELLELKANPDKRSRGTIIEARLEQGRGVIATALIQEGTLRVGDPIVAGVFSGKVRALLNEHGKRIPEATPGVPIAILGLSGAPVAGDELHGVPDEKTARELGAKLQLIRREREIADIAHVSLESLFARIEEGSVKDLNLIVKGDVQGSVEVVCESLARIESEKVKVRILHRGVGAISESDIMLASASDAIILGFGVAVPADVIPLQQKERVDIRTYNIIYDAIEDIKKAMLGLLADEEREVILGNLEVLEIFRSSKAGLVIGGVVREGKLIKGRNVRVLRDNRVLANSRLVSLRRFKDEVNEVSQGLECGVGITNFQDIHPRDIIECFQVEKVAATL